MDIILRVVSNAGEWLRLGWLAVLVPFFRQKSENHQCMLELEARHSTKPSNSYLPLAAVNRAMPRTASSRKKAAAAAAADPEPEEYSDSEGAEDVSMMFSQQMPEMSQVLPQPKDREKQNLDSLDPHVREKLLTTLSRLLLFKALAGETIDKVRGRVCV